jgi:hypothetical protein
MEEDIIDSNTEHGDEKNILPGTNNEEEEQDDDKWELEDN